MGGKAPVPEDGPKQVAVLWHQDRFGQPHVVGVFEDPDDAADMLTSQHGERLLTEGNYRVTVRPLMRAKG